MTGQGNIQIMRRSFFKHFGTTIRLLSTATVLVFNVGLVGCHWKETTRPSVLIVAIDRLGVSRSGCSAEKDEAPRSGFREICDDSVRFTHAFTTSPMSVPAMGSILTGLYPYRSGLRHNGGGELGTLSSSAETIAERALEMKYRTLFVSGAAPLLRRTGLHQGFEVFDDAVPTTSRHMHRPARTVVDTFSRWLDLEVHQEPFFAVLHMGDMQIPWSPMPDDSGRVRESTVRGQFEEVDESLWRLWKFLKEKKIWDQTTIVVVGLQGDSQDVRNGEVPALDLHSDTTHVTLMIKEGRREKSSEPGHPAYNWVPKSWSFDANVSLADVGVTLFDWIDGKKPQINDPDAARSLKSALVGPGEAGDEWSKEDRLIVSESAWAKWQIDSRLPIRSALRKGPYLYIYDSEPLIYNTLTDGFEVAPLPKRNQRTLALQTEFSALAAGFGFEPFVGLSEAAILEERWARNYFLKRMGAHVPDNSKIDDQRIEIVAQTSERASAWLKLRSWQMGEPGSPAPTSCSQLVFSDSSNKDLSSSIEAELARVCPFRGARDIARWYRSTDVNERARLLEAIFRADQQRLTAVRIAEASLALGQIWEVGTVRKKDLEGIEILLAQPEAARLLQLVMRRIRSQPEP